MNIPAMDSLMVALASAAAGVAGAVGWSLRTRKQVSRDGVELERDKVERAELGGIVAEVRQLRQEVKENARTIAQLTSDNIHLQSSKDDLKQELRNLKRGLDEEIRRVVDTNFAEFDSKH